MNTSSSVHIFWDNSNIFHGAQHVAEDREGSQARRLVRLHFDHLLTLAGAGRPVAQAVCVGSTAPGLEKAWNRLKAQGVEVICLERGAQTGTEQGVDETLQSAMLRVGYDEPPGVAVLLTGDGAGSRTGRGFTEDLKRLASLGWGIEVLSWVGSCHHELRALAEEEGVFVALDPYYSSITFVEGERAAWPLSLRHRPRTDPPGSLAA